MTPSDKIQEATETIAENAHDTASEVVDSTQEAGKSFIAKIW